MRPVDVWPTLESGHSPEVGSFEDCESKADIADEMLAQLIESFRPLDERDRQGLIGAKPRKRRNTLRLSGHARLLPSLSIPSI